MFHPLRIFLIVFINQLIIVALVSLILFIGKLIKLKSNIKTKVLIKNKYNGIDTTPYLNVINNKDSNAKKEFTKNTTT